MLFFFYAFVYFFQMYYNSTWKTVLWQSFTWNYTYKDFFNIIKPISILNKAWIKSNQILYSAVNQTFDPKNRKLHCREEICKFAISSLKVREEKMSFRSFVEYWIWNPKILNKKTNFSKVFICFNTPFCRFYIAYFCTSML